MGTTNISIDAMGGDYGPDVTIPAIASVLKNHPEVQFKVVGDLATMNTLLETNNLLNDKRISLIHAPQVVEMNEKPSSALRGKKNSSMRLAIDQVKHGSSHACVSAGNTGALMAISKFVLKTLPGITRPAICSAMPGRVGTTHVLDLGANVDCKAEELLQFAVMGAVLAEAIDNCRSPKVALLNIGQEEIKGNESVKKASVLLEGSSLNYVGFAEANELFSGNYDVIVCDGFVGNVALKASEGVALMLQSMAIEEFSSSWLKKIGAIAAAPGLSALKRRADPGRYNGASLLGLKGIVVKSHGGADSFAFSRAIEVALVEVKQEIPDKINHLLSPILSQIETSK
jgi:glycerol-3-phosphate acyltransferase PlsX